MKASILKSLVTAFSFAAICLLSLSAGRAADSSTPAADPAAASPMGACCGQPPAEEATKKTVACGEGTVSSGNTCVPVKVNQDRQAQPLSTKEK